jgi:exonuclease V gamma subunit
LFVSNRQPDDKKKDQPRGRVLLAGCIVAPSEEDSQTFTVSASNGDVFKLKATDVRQRQLWVDRLRQVAQQQDSRATMAAHQSDRLNDVRESLLTTQKAQTKLSTAIESFTHSDDKLLLLKATSHGSLMALEQSFAILQSINESQALHRSA